MGRLFFDGYDVGAVADALVDGDNGAKGLTFTAVLSKLMVKVLTILTSE